MLTSGPHSCSNHRRRIWGRIGKIDQSNHFLELLRCYTARNYRLCATGPLARQNLVVPFTQNVNTKLAYDI